MALARQLRNYISHILHSLILNMRPNQRKTAKNCFRKRTKSLPHLPLYVLSVPIICSLKTLFNLIPLNLDNQASKENRNLFDLARFQVIEGNTIVSQDQWKLKSVGRQDIEIRLHACFEVK